MIGPAELGVFGVAVSIIVAFFLVLRHFLSRAESTDPTDEDQA